MEERWMGVTKWSCFYRVKVAVSGVTKLPLR